MLTYLQVSNIFLWIVVISMSVILIKVLKKSQNQLQPGMMPQHDFQQFGLDVSSTFPLLDLKSSGGTQFHLSYPESQGIIVLISSVNCLPCKQLFSHIAQFKMKNSHIQIVALVDGLESEINNTMNYDSFGIPTYHVDPNILNSIQTDIFPFAYLLTADKQTILAKNLAAPETLEILVSQLNIINLAS